MFTPSAIARGSTARRCSRRIRWRSVPSCTSATCTIRSHVDAPDYRDQEPLLIRLLRRGDHVAEAARLLQRLDKGIKVFGSSSRARDIDDELPLRTQAWLNSRNPHVIGECLFELIEEFAPGERALIDDVVGLASRAGNHF